MPELADLEAFSKTLNRKWKEAKLHEVRVFQKEKIHASEKELNATLSGKALKVVYREGKQLFFDFGKDAVFSMHLMLNGKLQLNESEPPKYPVASFEFENENVLVLSDFQKIVNITLNPKPMEGVDALSDELTGKWLFDRIRKSKASIKAVLMDQKIIGGIGNAYADEILWAAKIHPESITNKIPEKEVDTLVKAIKSVFEHAIKEILKSSPDIISGEIRDFMVVHNSKTKQTPAGDKIHNTKIAGRVTYYTDQQILYKYYVSHIN